MRVLALVCLAACGRIGFDPNGPTGDGGGGGGDGPRMSIDAALVPPPSSARTFTAGFGHICAQHAGKLSCWGNNQEGQLGMTPGGAFATPQLLAGTEWALVATGELGSCGIHLSGALECWGSNFDGENGVMMGLPSSGTPMPVTGGGTWIEIALRRYSACGIRNDHTLWCWGNNTTGQLGLGDDGATMDRYVPTQVDARTDWATVSVSGDHACAATTGGAAYCWGGNQFGMLGVGDRVERDTPTPVIGDIQFVKLVSGKQHQCGLDVNGGLWCWGANNLFQLGFADQLDRLVPTQVDHNTYTDLAPGWFHTCALRTDQTLWCWGDNNQGAYGAPSPESATQVQIGAGTGWTSITAGADFSCMFDDGGQYWCMGNNPYGQLGQGDASPRTVPVQVTLP